MARPEGLETSCSLDLCQLSRVRSLASTPTHITSSEGLTFATGIFQLSDRHGRHVDVREEEILGRSVFERFDDSDSEEAVGQRSESVRQCVSTFSRRGRAVVAHSTA
jgi:hypothetical protein